MFIVQQYSLQNENQHLGLCAVLQQKRKGRKQLLFWRDFYSYTHLVYYMAIYFALQTGRCCAMVALPLAERLRDYSFSHLVASCTPELQRWHELNFVYDFILEETFEVNTLKHMRNSLWGRTRSILMETTCITMLHWSSIYYSAFKCMLASMYVLYPQVYFNFSS